jgi:glycosyltransferase involved in cell wall biosynthesis
MKVLLIAPELHPNSFGGGGVVIKNLVQGLEETECPPIVLSALQDPNGLFDRPYFASYGRTHIFWLPLIPSPIIGFQLKSYLPPNIFSTLLLFAVIKGKDFDVAHIHGYGHIFCDLAAFLCRLNKKPYLYTIHGFPKEPGKRGGVLKALYGGYNNLFGRPAVRGAKKIIAVSNSLANECRDKFPGCTVEVIPNGISPNYLSKPSDQMMKIIADRYSLNGKKVILCLGRLCEGKGFQFVIRALPLVLEKVPEAFLVIAGEDDRYGYYRELFRLCEIHNVSKNVRFVGKITNDEEKICLLWQSSIVAIPSREETFGMVAPEAMASGRPIVASNIGGLSEILAHDSYTRFVEYGNVEEIANHIIAILSDTDLQKLAAATRFSRLGKLDMGSMVEACLNQYSNLAKAD